MASRYFSAALDVAPPRGLAKRKAHALEKPGVQGPHARTDSPWATDDEASATQSDDDEAVNDVAPPVEFPAAPLQNKLDLPSVARPTRRQRNLKQQHIAAVTAVLHKCLLTGDYARASQAFGLLLRIKVNNRRIDLRKKALWGIGAEILLHQSDTTTATPAPPLEAAFSEQGFAAAKAFFERLILQYPHRKHRSHDVDELTFYPAMLGVFIFQIQARYRDSPEAQQLKDAQDIAKRIESLTRFPPFDRHVPTLKMQADVASWMADLTKHITGDKASVRAFDDQSASIRRQIDLLSRASPHA